jgi:hypothetical protein
MFGQVLKSSHIQKHAIHWKTIGYFETFACFQDILSEEDFDFRPEAFSSYKEPSPTSSKSTSDTTPTRLESS